MNTRAAELLEEIREREDELEELIRAHEARFIYKLEGNKIRFEQAVLNCAYCGYVNGLVGYVREIVARTEQYWCPIIHAHKVLNPHRRYLRFTEFGDAKAYRENITRRDKRHAAKLRTDE